MVPGLRIGYASVYVVSRSSILKAIGSSFPVAGSPVLGPGLASLR